MTITIAATAAAPAPAVPSPAPALAGAGSDFTRQLDLAETRQRDATASEPAHASGQRGDDRRADGLPASKQHGAAAPRATHADAGAGGSDRTASPPSPPDDAESDADGSRASAPCVVAKPALEDEEADTAVPANGPCAWLAHHPLPETPLADVTPRRSARSTQRPAGVGDAAALLPATARVCDSDAAAAVLGVQPALAAGQSAPDRGRLDGTTPVSLASGAVEGARPLAGMPASTAAAATATQADLPAAPGTPHFPTALAAQLSTWVRDGVQQARLHLNPSELGPIGVRISLDGTHAQIDFQAAHAATRAALEAAVPSLAGALHQSGFTLSGGGVFEQPQHSRHSADGGGRGRASGTAHDDADAVTAPLQAARAVARRGIVDLYA